MNLISFNPFLCGSRDSLSLYFEYTYEELPIKVHRVFYNAEQYDNLAYGKMNTESVDTAESSRSISIHDLRQSLSYILRKLNQGSLTNDPKIRESLVESLNYVVDGLEITDLVGPKIDELNLLFYSYRYRLSSREFVTDTTCEFVDRMIHSIDFLPALKEDDNICDEHMTEDINDGDANKYELRVYNVGQANCSALIEYLDAEQREYRVVAVFDFGLQSKRARNHKLDEMIGKIDEKTIMFVSHFHYDHINNLFRNSDIKASHWVIPSLDPMKCKAYKVFQATLFIMALKHHSGKIHVFSTPCRVSRNLTIHQNRGRSKDWYSRGNLTNAQSLVCVLNINNKHVLIPGDALYEEFDAIHIGLPFDYVLVPHHCCQYSDPANTKSSAKIREIIGENTVGIVSCGVNSYGHANVSHLSWFRKNYLFSGSRIYNDFKAEIGVSSEKQTDYYCISFA